MTDGNKNYEEARNLVTFQLTRKHADFDEIWHKCSFRKNIRRVFLFLCRQSSQYDKVKITLKFGDAEYT